MSSLGYRRGCDHNSTRPGEIPTRTITVAIPTTVDAPADKEMSSRISVPKGFLPLLFNAVNFLLVPVFYEYVDYTWTDSTTRAVVIAASAVYALSVVFANDCVTWFNMVLFFHIGIEVKVLDILMDFARSTTTSDGDEILAWTGFVVIIVHLIPFLLVDNTMFLALLAVAGVIVNAGALVYLTDIGNELTDLRLLLTGLSSVSLLGATLCISGVCGVSTSMLTALQKAMTDGTWLTCSNYLM
jgi:hypothetical protein